ncbi:hypothetical protein [Sphingobium fuliginis]|uniref:hypothetical protein n=1 Tax=Sphingobium fuliginis (strain ATCC 27551) TaxID=336203 RepID=UPI001FCAAED8|nr:hypothetical protein [Sphingobium fuliginis]
MAAALERRGAAPDFGRSLCAGGQRRHDISTARIYTWRNKLRQPPALTEFVEAVVDDGEQQNGHQAAMPVIIVDLVAKGE